MRNEAFSKIKQQMSAADFLVHYNRKLPLKLAVHVRPNGVGWALSHIFPEGDEKPISYASRTLSESERNYIRLDKESLAIIYAVKRFHQYLY